MQMDLLKVVFISIYIVALVTILFVAFLIGKRYGQSTARKKQEADIKNACDEAIKRSRSVLTGQISEQIAPFLPDFPCNPADVRFVGKPVDFVGFSGITDRDTVDEILLIEVKTGKSMLNKREKEVKKAIKEGRVRYIEYRIGG